MRSEFEFMRFHVLLTSVRPAAAALAALTLAGCSSGPSLSGPSWNLTGSRASVATPPKVMSQPATANPNVPEPVYRGGRDPQTGRAMTEGPTPPPSQAAPPTVVATATPYPAASQPRHVTTTVVMPPAAAPAPVAASAPPAVVPGQRPQVVEVRQGDSLAKIAADYKVSIASLMQANKLRDPYVSPGQWLVLPKR